MKTQTCSINEAFSFSPGVWGYVLPPKPDELPLEFPNSDRYATNLTVRNAYGTVEIIGCLFPYICSVEDFDWAFNRVRSNASLIAAAPSMYKLLASLLSYLRCAANEDSMPPSLRKSLILKSSEVCSLLKQIRG